MNQEWLNGGLAAAGLAAAGAWVLSNAALRPASQLFGATLIAGDDPSEVALTYDDGPNDAATADLLAVLQRHGVRATFFMIGRFVQQRPEIARDVLAAGHLVGNHTMTHPWLAWQPEHVIREELRACNEIIEDTIAAPVRYFRAPHGARRPVVLRVAREMGLVPVQWNVMAKDWEQIGAGGIVSNVERGLQQCRKRGGGANILLHDGYDREMGADRSATVAATDLLLASLPEREYHAVTVAAWD